MEYCRIDSLIDLQRDESAAERESRTLTAASHTIWTAVNMCI